MASAAPAYAFPGTTLGSSFPRSWNQPVRRSLYGDAVVVLFLLAQCFDGVFTYVGVRSFGIGIEANPLMASIMTAFGHGAGLTGAKAVAAALGIGLHLREIHGAVAILTCFYMAAAILPWIAILFF
jgi:uncharacterized membrane protein